MIIEMTPYDSPGTLIFCCQKSQRNSNPRFCVHYRFCTHYTFVVYVPMNRQQSHLQSSTQTTMVSCSTRLSRHQCLPQCRRQRPHQVNSLHGLISIQCSAPSYGQDCWLLAPPPTLGARVCGLNKPYRRRPNTKSKPGELARCLVRFRFSCGQVTSSFVARLDNCCLHVAVFLTFNF